MSAVKGYSFNYFFFFKTVLACIVSTWAFFRFLEINDMALMVVVISSLVFLHLLVPYFFPNIGIPSSLVCWSIFAGCCYGEISLFVLDDTISSFINSYKHPIDYNWILCFSFIRDVILILLLIFLGNIILFSFYEGNKYAKIISPLVMFIYLVKAMYYIYMLYPFMGEYKVITAMGYCFAYIFNFVFISVILFDCKKNIVNPMDDKSQ